MKGLRNIFALAFMLSSLAASAQHWLPFNTLVHDAEDQVSPTAFLGRFTSSWNDASVGVDLRREDSAFLPQEGNGKLEGFFNYGTYVRFGNGSAARGGARYSRGVKRDVIWNSTSDFSILYPYVMADSLECDLQSEQYSFNGYYATHAGKFVLGGGAQYRALHEYRDFDPRPRNITSDLKVSASAGYPVKSYLLDLSASFRKYYQNQALTFYNKKGANTNEFQFLGLGAHYPRFEGSENFYRTYYKGFGWSAALSMRPADGADGWSSALSLASLSLKRRLPILNNAVLCELNTLNAGIFTSLRNTKGRVRHNTLLKAGYEHRQGIEPLLDSKSGSDFGSMLDVEMYTADILSGSIESVIEFPREKGTLALNPSASAYSFSSGYVYPERKMDFAYAEAGAGTSYRSSIGKLAYYIGAEALYKVNLGGSLDIPSDFTQELIAAHYGRMHAAFTDNCLSAGLNARIKYGICYLSMSYRRLFFGSGNGTDCLCSALGLEF